MVSALRSVGESEELVVNVAATINNLSFYQTESSALTRSRLTIAKRKTNGLSLDWIHQCISLSFDPPPSVNSLQHQWWWNCCSAPVWTPCLKPPVCLEICPGPRMYAALSCKTKVKETHAVPCRRCHVRISWEPPARRSTVCTSANCCVMFGLNLSARPAAVSVNMPAYCGCISPIISAPPVLSSFFTLSPSAPVCGDTAWLQEPRDVLLRLWRPHEPGSGLPYEGQAFRGGGRCQVSTDFVSWLISVEKRQRKWDKERTISFFNATY